MTVRQGAVSLESGDELTVTLYAFAGELPRVLLSVLDRDGTTVPTAELSVREAADLRELLRRMLEAAAVAVHGTSW